MASLATQSGPDAGAAAGEAASLESSASDANEQAPSGFDASIRKTVSQIPLCTINAGPRDGDRWKARLKEEIRALITYIRNNKKNDNDWFTIKPNKDGTFWEGRCWYFHESIRYEFKLQFDTPVAYPSANPEIALPEIDGKTAKMYRGGKICLTLHFQPLWRKNCPKFGIAHALALGLAPWLAAEVPDLVSKGLIKASGKN